MASETKGKHTPGPWSVDGPHDLVSGGRCLAISADGTGGELTVATVAFNEPADDHKAIEACRADADLIAAAPDLLAALDEVTAQLEACLPATFLDGSKRKDPAIDLARAAIAKAKGAA